MAIVLFFFQYVLWLEKYPYDNSNTSVAYTVVK